MIKILARLLEWFVALNPTVTKGSLVVGTTWLLYVWVNDQWLRMIDYIDAVVVPSYGGSLSIAPLGLLDTFIPLHETLTFFTAWLALLAVCAAVRIVKSFIPTVAS